MQQAKGNGRLLLLHVNTAQPERQFAHLTMIWKHID